MPDPHIRFDELIAALKEHDFRLLSLVWMRWATMISPQRAWEGLHWA